MRIMEHSAAEVNAHSNARVAYPALVQRLNSVSAYLKIYQQSPTSGLSRGSKNGESEKSGKYY